MYQLPTHLLQESNVGTVLAEKRMQDVSKSKANQEISSNQVLNKKTAFGSTAQIRIFFYSL